VGAAGVVLVVSARALREPLAQSLAGLALGTLGVALVGLATRAAQVAVDAGGVRWGWAAVGFRLDADRLRGIDIYRDGVALRPRRGATWFIAARDWDRFELLVRAVGRLPAPIGRHPGRAPLRARLQSYGRFLDAMLVLSAAAATGLAVVASVRY
jgi:hypothetical protein